MKVPPKRKGNVELPHRVARTFSPSMKVPPKRKGNALAKKEAEAVLMPSMKVPPKRKGNDAPANSLSFHIVPQ